MTIGPRVGGEHVHGGSAGDRSRRRTTVLGIGIEFIDQPFADTVHWSFSEPDHKLLVWRHGRVSHKEVEFEGRSVGPLIPHTSSIWVIPAGQRATAVATEAECSFAELTFPTLIMGPDTLRAVAGEQDPLLHHMIEEILNLDGRGDVAARLLQETLVDGLRLRIRDRYGQMGPAPPVQGRTLSDAEQRLLIEFIRDCLSSEIDLPTMAGLVDMSLETFRHAFKKAFQVTPYQFVMDQRIAEAKMLLESVPSSITEISGLAGFCSPSHFAATFKQRVGVTPTVYRQTMRAASSF